MEYQRKNFLQDYDKNQFKTIAATVVVSIGASLLIVGFLLSQSAVLVDKQMIKTYYSGVLLQQAWPKLSKAEKTHLELIAENPASDNSVDTSSDSSTDDNQ